MRTDRAYARPTDPETSHWAAGSLSPETLRESQADVLRVLDAVGPQEDTDLRRIYEERARQGYVNKQSSSGLRTRRKELCRKGLVRDSGRKVILEKTGNPAIVWEVAPPRPEFKEHVRMTATDGPRSISNSELTTFADCQRRWWFTYVLQRGVKREHKAVTGALAFGSRIHTCLERKYRNGEDPLAVYEELHAEALHELAEIETARGTVVADQRKKLEEEHSLGRAMLEGFVQWAAETGLDEGMTFLAAEQLVEVDSGIPGVKLRGKLDQVWRRDVDGALMFRDWKTAADLRAGPASLPRDEQMMFYVMLMRLQHIQQGDGSGDWSGVPRGGKYTMLKKVKRTARAQPPFYDEHEIMFNDRAIRSMFLRTHRRIQQMEGARAALATGEDHRYVVPPRPSKDCSWKCPFVAVCPMADDSSDDTLFAVLDQVYDLVDPYEYYGDEKQLDI